VLALLITLSQQTRVGRDLGERFLLQRIPCWEFCTVPFATYIRNETDEAVEIGIYEAYEDVLLGRSGTSWDFDAVQEAGGVPVVLAPGGELRTRVSSMRDLGIVKASTRGQIIFCEAFPVPDSRALFPISRQVSIVSGHLECGQAVF
jgi:hypothetical protein